LRFERGKIRDPIGRFSQLRRSCLQPSAKPGVAFFELIPPASGGADLEHPLTAALDKAGGDEQAPSPSPRRLDPQQLAHRRVFPHPVHVRESPAVPQGRQRKTLHHFIRLFFRLAVKKEWNGSPRSGRKECEYQPTTTLSIRRLPSREDDDGWRESASQFGVGCAVLAPMRGVRGKMRINWPPDGGDFLGLDFRQQHENDAKQSSRHRSRHRKGFRRQ